MRRLFRFRVLPQCAALLVYGLFSVPCRAQETKERPALPDQKLQMTLAGVSMSQTIEAVSKAAHISVAADGEPILKKADFKFDGTIHDAIDSIARAFDYSWTVTKAGVVIMSKQFSDTRERPQVSLPEMLEMTRNMISALTLVDYDRDSSQWQGMVKKVAETFTPEQLRVLNKDEKLHGSSLTAQQQDALRGAILTNTFASQLQVWEALLPNLENMQQSHLQSREADASNLPAGTAKQRDYLYVYRGANGILSVLELQHIKYGSNNENLVTP